MLDPKSAQNTSRPFTSLEFRTACGRFATGVTVVTALGADGSPVGVTINSFSSVSLEPPLVLFCLDRGALSFAAFEAAKSFAINVLSDDQQALSERFAQQGAPKFGDLDLMQWDTGCPILKGCLANLECLTDAVHDGGDHIIVVGRVCRLAVSDAGRPLVYYAGRYAGLDAPPEG